MRKRVERTEYQNEQKWYAHDLLEDFMDDSYYKELEIALEKVSMRRFYAGLLQHLVWCNTISCESLTGNKEDLTFYFSYEELKHGCEWYCMYDMSYEQIFAGLQFLRYIGLVNRIKPEAYKLVDPDPSVIEVAIKRINKKQALL